MERGEYTTEELAAVEAVSGWSASEFAVPLHIGWRMVALRKTGSARPAHKRRTVWAPVLAGGGLGEDLYSAGEARDWAATY